MFSVLFPQITAPIPLWQMGSLDNVRNQSDPSTHQPPETAAQSPKPYTPSHSSAPQKGNAQVQKASSKTASEFFTVGKSPSDNSREQRRPPSGKTGGGRVGAAFVPVNATSIGAYKQIKKSMGETRLDMAGSSKGEQKNFCFLQFNCKGIVITLK